MCSEHPQSVQGSAMRIRRRRFANWLGVTFLGMLFIASVSGVVGLLKLLRRRSSKLHLHRLVTLAGCLMEYKDLLGHFPERASKANGELVSWRLGFLNELHDRSPSIARSLTPAPFPTFPLRPASPQPPCYGTPSLTTFCVASVRGSNWDHPRVANDKQPGRLIIVVDVEVEHDLALDWWKPIDIFYERGKVVLASDEGPLVELKTVRDVLAVASNGTVREIAGPISGVEFAELLARTDW